MVFDPQLSGLSGHDETTAFEQLKPLSKARAAALCHLTLMGLMPALVEQQFDAFSAAVGDIQRVVADYFAPAQNGAYTSSVVAEAVMRAKKRFKLRGVGQSSWGPTGFIFVPDVTTATKVVNDLSAAGYDRRLEYRGCTALNDGASIDL